MSHSNQTEERQNSDQLSKSKQSLAGKTTGLSGRVPVAQLDASFADRLLAFLKGELTWAQVEGWSGEQAYFFAKIATDLMEAGQLAAAEKMFSALNALNPEDWFFPYCLAQIARQRGEMDRAIDYLDEAACNGPDRPEPLLLRSLCHLAVRNVEEARQDLRRVTELSTDSTNQEISKMAGVAEAMMERLEVSA